MLNAKIKILAVNICKKMIVKYPGMRIKSSVHAIKDVSASNVNNVALIALKICIILIGKSVKP